MTSILRWVGKIMNPMQQEVSDGPIEAARAMRHKRGFVFLDSSLAGDGSVSILACEPNLTLRGRDWDSVSGELARRSGGGDGAAIGWVAYDGSFHFSFYDRLHVFAHGSARWDAKPGEFAPVPHGSNLGALNFKPLVDRGRFLEMVERARGYIAAGDIYQVCLSHPFEALGGGDAWNYYESLRACSPAPHGAFIDAGDLKIASASPECFLRMSGRSISTRPIKGTRPRRPDAWSDALSSQDLMTSSKEMAELVMITDLERNDLGQVCNYGSICVPELLRLEKYEQVFHLVSTVSGELREEVGHVEALRACFPGGSISGAPKKRALEIIKELEPHPRGLYTGAIGYFGYSGESQFSIAIRTAVFEPGRAHFHVGAGIVADSLAEAEWEETWHKAAGLLMAAGGNSPRAEAGRHGPPRTR